MKRSAMSLLRLWYWYLIPQYCLTLIFFACYLDFRPLGQCLDPKLQKGNGWRYPGISRPTYCLTSCSPVDRALVYQPSGPGLIPGMSHSETAITRGKILRTLLPPTTFSCTTCLDFWKNKAFWENEKVKEAERKRERARQNKVGLSWQIKNGYYILELMFIIIIF